MNWRIARSLNTLRQQINNAFPGRDTSSDGTIGDKPHQDTISDHNPDARGVVRAMDITHDPDHGMNIDRLFINLTVSRDPRIKYMIANRKIVSSTTSPWTIRRYTGNDPHTGHLHLSVVSSDHADDASLWSIGDTVTDIMIGGERLADYLPRIERALWWPIPRIETLLTEFITTERASDAAHATSLSALQAALDAVVQALREGSGTVLDTAAILQRIDAAAASVSELVQTQHREDLAALMQMLKDRGVQ